ncbi:hypothetical protein FAI40_01055 [Acetobacteraceae bacterium]|nr:hypothetical protein FAI40_01055 [Acetobacteraceae bacterium]
MKRNLFLSLLCLPLLAGCSLFSSKDQKNFKADSPPPQTEADTNTPTESSTTNAEDSPSKKPVKHIAKEEILPAPEEIVSGNQPQHHISPASAIDPTAMEDNANPSRLPDGSIAAPVSNGDSGPALSARQQERQAAIKLRDSLERIQDGKANNSEEDKQLSELPSSQRKAMLEQLNQALLTK